MTQKTHSRWRKALLIALLIVVLFLAVAAGTYWYFFVYNTFSLKLVLYSPDSITLEYGESFSQEEAIPVFYGTQIFQDGVPLDIPVTVDGRVDTEKLGTYELRYHSGFHGLSAEISRTVHIVDTQLPVITLTPDTEGNQEEPKNHYEEAGFSAWDNYDGDITDLVVRTELEGSISYSVTDSSGNTAVEIRELPDYDWTPPVIELVSGETVRIPVGTHYEEPGFSAWDGHDGDLTDSVVVTQDTEEIVWYQPGTYTFEYSVTDSNGNTATATRTVIQEPNPRPAIIWPKEKTIYLTFDDGPCLDTVRLLDVLKRYNVHATFFVVDTGYPAIMERIVDEGHSIGIHTCTHNYKQIYASPEAYLDDLFQMQQIILDATGQETWLMRFPGGSSNLISSFNPGIMTLLTQAVEDLGFSYFDWNVDSDDAGRAGTARQVIRNVKDGVSANAVSVVLQHDIHSCSVDAVEEIILWGLNNGYSFKPLMTDSPEIHHGVQN